jgi:pSer/pThr/pTyr-binding forkhead associated (FHA) protein
MSNKERPAPAHGAQTQRIPQVAHTGLRPGTALEELPAGMTVSLEITAGPGKGSTFRLTRRLTIVGREEGEIRIPDVGVSRRHASLEVHDLETIILRDLSSTNGTYHNGKLIAFCKVSDGDEIRVGTSHLTLSVDILG